MGRAETNRTVVGLSVVLAVLASGCARERSRGPRAARAALDAAGGPKATGRDPEAIDEGLVDALRELRDKFRCNRISGCKAEAVVRGYGRVARPHLERLFARAPRRVSWRTRVVRIVAELEDPGALPFLLHALRDRDDAVRAYAVMGLGLLHRPELRERFRELTTAGVGLQLAMSRLSAWAALAWLGEAGARAGFEAELAMRCRQFLAGNAVWWGLRLCRRRGPGAMPCRAELPAASRHPSFIVRREVVRWLQERGTRADLAVGEALAADPIHSIARRAKAWVRRR